MGKALGTSNPDFFIDILEQRLFKPLHVIDHSVYRGANLYSKTPMIRVQVDLGSLEEWPSNRLPEFTDRLVELLPGLASHGCSSGEPGGLILRLKEGTWLGHVIEHIAIELQNLAGIDVARGKTRSVLGKPGHYNIMYAYLYEQAGLCAGRLALDLAASLLPEPFRRFKNTGIVHAMPAGNEFILPKGLEMLKDLVRQEKLGPTTQSLVEEAVRRHIHWQRLDDHSLVQIGTGKYRKLVRASITSATSNIAVETASDKELTKALLDEVNIPVPAGHVVRSAERAVEMAQSLGYLVVAKPLNGNHGRGVTTGLRSAQEVAEAFARAQAHSRDVIIEKHFEGKDYRVLVVNGEVIAATERVPAHVIGNGTDTIESLIAGVNANPRRGKGHEEAMTRIQIDDTLISWLARSQLALTSVPARHQRIVLTATANMSTGGTSIDRTDEIHPDNASIARRAALAVGLDVAGIDLVLPDIARSWRETGGGIVEVNASPGFRMHLHPTEGRSRNVAKSVLSALFPNDEETHVPVVAITGTNGKSTTVRMVAHILRQSGLTVGYTTTSGIFVNDDCLWRGDASGPKSARILLRDPTIDVAVLETARGGILREGLGVSECDVGAVLNVAEDHLGMGGIDSVDDMAKVKSVVAEAVRRQGVSVLNADDPRTLSMAQRAGGSVCYFSTLPSAGNAVRGHIEKGGCAVTRELTGGGMQIVLYRDGKRFPVIGVNDIPATLQGVAAFNTENALAATAIANALGVDPYIIQGALRTFSSTYQQNPGRFNMHDGHGFRVVMDYAHNPTALRAFFNVIRDMRMNYLRVIGHVSTPGDRRDEDIVEVGRIAGRELDLAVFREVPDRRGRPKGELLRLLAEGARSVGCTDDRIICVTTEEEATDICLKAARPGDLVILMPSVIDACWNQMLAFKPSLAKQREQAEAEMWHVNA